jgi:hypothetical protein
LGTTTPGTLWNSRQGSIDDVRQRLPRVQAVRHRPPRKPGVGDRLVRPPTGHSAGQLGLGFTNAAVAGPENEPDVVFTSILKAMRRRPDGEYDYIGAMAYPDAATNPLTDIDVGRCRAPMSLARLGGRRLPRDPALPVAWSSSATSAAIDQARGIGRVPARAGKDQLRYTWSNPGDRR